jgi:predicted nucleic acid-binding protein
MFIIVDSGILGQLARPTLGQDSQFLKRWFDRTLIRANVCSSKICDYEIRRGLLLAQKQGLVAEGLTILDRLHQIIEFLPVDETILNIAADIWATARMGGQPTAGDRNLDADMIICATWKYLKTYHPGQEVIIATTNIRHLSLFANAVTWEDLDI